MGSGITLALDYLITQCTLKALQSCSKLIDLSLKYCKYNDKDKEPLSQITKMLGTILIYFSSSNILIYLVEAKRRQLLVLKELPRTSKWHWLRLQLGHKMPITRRVQDMLIGPRLRFVLWPLNIGTSCNIISISNSGASTKILFIQVCCWINCWS